MLDRAIASSPSTPRARSGSWQRALARVAIFVAGIALVAVFIARVGVGGILAELERAGAKSFWLLVPYAIGTAISAFPWATFLPRGVRPSPLGLIQSRFAASSANSLLPLFGMAGEPARLLWLAPSERARGVAAIAVDRLLYNAANGVLLMAGAVAALTTPLDAPLALAALAIGLVTLAATPLGFRLLATLGVGSRAQLLLRKLLGQPRRDTAFGASVDAALGEVRRGSRRALWLGGAVHFAGRAIVALEVYVGLAVLGADYGLAVALVFAVVPIALSLIFSSVPGQLGVQEGAQMLVAEALGVSSTVVLSLVLLQRFRQLAFAALMPILLSRARSRVASAGGAPGAC